MADAGKHRSKSVQTSLLVLTCILLWVLAPSPDTAIGGGSPLPLGAAAPLHSTSHQEQLQDLTLPQQQQQLRLRAATVAVDVVYLWVNGSDPLLQQELDQHSPKQQHNSTTDSQGSPEPRAARYDSSRDELRYSLRSLEQYMPWYRHLYIVTNGQVPSWLDLSNPRVTVVPHSTIFENASELPTFNSNAIQTKLLNIPGLADSFIVMDDDWFLAAPWTLQDFIGEDGAQVVTGSGSADETGAYNPYLASVRHCNTLFKHKFGPWKRSLPAHSPHFMQRKWLKRVMAEIPGEYKQTGANRFRTDHDLLMAPAYEWYIDQFQPGQHRRAPDVASGFFALYSGLARGLILNSMQYSRSSDRSTNSADRQVLDQNNINHTEGRLAVAAVAAEVAAGKTVSVLTGFEYYLMPLLQQVWAKPGSKMVCLNDDIADAFSYARQLLNPVVATFLAHRYPKPSRYEVAAGAERDCRRIKSSGFGKLPTSADIAAACAARRP